MKPFFYSSVALIALAAPAFAQVTNENVVVSATRIPTPLAQIASSVTVITAADIEARQQRSLPDLLRSVSGVNIVQTGGAGGQTSLFLRGANPNHTKLLLDGIFGRESFLNEIIWAYDYGARARKKWPAKHDNILWYAKDPDNYVFNYDAMERIPYMAPGLVGPEKAARGKTPTDVWWHTIVSPTGKEKTGYPTQKPLGILTRIIQASSNPGDTVLDFFAGSGTTGEAAYRLGHSFILVDNNRPAIEVMKKRFKGLKDVRFVKIPPSDSPE